jgi:hypothetical protein
VCDVDALGFDTEPGACAAPVDGPGGSGLATLGPELGLETTVVVVAAVVVVVVGVTSCGGTLGGPPDPNAHPSTLPGVGV